ncbi:MAG TPA: alpha/beta hydrolase-fold protein [Candidatus Dormibacteraeota bacterium]
MSDPLRPGPPWSRPLAGRLDHHLIESAALRGNPLGDPDVRPLWVYTPPGNGPDTERRLPSIYLIQGMTGQVDMWQNRSALRPTVVELIDALFSDLQIPPAIVVMVDCWTSYGGSQFLDSPGTGLYHTYLCTEVVPFVDAHYRTLAARDHRGITGKSSGGYGALVTPMLRPDLFGGLASHSGDALFELCYLTEFPAVVRALRDRYGGSYDAFWKDFRSRPALSRPGDEHLLNTYAMAACYSTDADGTVRLPFDPRSGELDAAVWERWLRWDPVRMVPRHADALRSLRAVYLDAGKSDEYCLDLGAEAVRLALERIGVTDVRFELFDGAHGGIEYRYPLALRFLAERLSP